MLRVLQRCSYMSGVVPETGCGITPPRASKAPLADAMWRDLHPNSRERKRGKPDLEKSRVVAGAVHRDDTALPVDRDALGSAEQLEQLLLADPELVQDGGVDLRPRSVEA